MTMARLLLVILSLASTWMTSEGQRDTSILSKALPRDTFIISNPAIRPSSGYINPYPAAFILRRGSGSVVRHHPGNTQDPIYHRPILFNRDYPTRQNPLRRQHYRPHQSQTSVSRFSLNRQRIQQPVAPLRTILPQTQETIPQNQAVPDTLFITSDGDCQTTHASESNRNSPQRPPVSPAANLLPGGQNPNRHPLCLVSPPTGDCRAAFPRYFYNPQTDQCDCFLYGGCGPEGLAYSYGTLEECVSTCAPSNTEEGPVCDELFFDGDTFFDSPAEKPSSSKPVAPQTNIDHIPDNDLLNLFGNFVSPQDALTIENNRLRPRSHAG